MDERSFSQAQSIQYRAWGALKTMTDGSSHTSSLLYNSRLQPTHFDLSGNLASQNFDYYNDGRISFVHNTSDMNFDRSYSYDALARIGEAKSGGQARGDSGANPYHETFAYDVWNNLTARASDTWDTYSLTDNATYTNNRRSGWGYDADGRNTDIDTRHYTFDAAGQMTLMTGQKWLANHYVNISQSAGYDGDGAKVKDTTAGITTYYLRSSVLRGAILNELNAGGQKQVGYVYSPSGQLLAQQANDEVSWKHSTPAGTANYEIKANGAVTRVEFDPLGADIGLTAPAIPDTGGGEGDLGGNHVGGIMSQRWADFFNLSGGCALDGLAASCSSAMSVVSAGAGVIGPGNTTRWSASLNNGQGGYQFFRAFAMGQSWGNAPGWVPGPSGSVRGGPPSLKNVSPEEAARRRAIVAEFGRVGFGDEDTELENSSDDHEYAHGRVRCPPTQQQINQSAALQHGMKEARDRANRDRDTGRTRGWIEHGGWILWKIGTASTLTYLPKEPETRFNTPPEYQFTDTSTRIWLHNPGLPPRGWEFVATYHVHPDNGGPDPGDTVAADAVKVPGFVGDPDGKIFMVGNFRRGIINSDLPATCR